MPSASNPRSARYPTSSAFGFADRSTVATARDYGASIVLDLPCDVDDLVDALERAAASRGPDPAHVVPPVPLGLRAARSRKK